MWSLSYGLLPESGQDHLLMGILDVFWPLFILVSQDGARWVAGGHLLIGYATLGTLLALRPAQVLRSRQMGGRQNPV